MTTPAVPCRVPECELNSQRSRSDCHPALRGLCSVCKAVARSRAAGGRDLAEVAHELITQGYSATLRNCEWCGKRAGVQAMVAAEDGTWECRDGYGCARAPARRSA